MFNFFEELFAPGRKHVSDEQKRLELSRVDLGIGDPNRGPIDLTSGKVTVRAPVLDGASEPRNGRMRPVAPEQDAVLDRPRAGKPVSGPERRAEEDPEG
ncbi:MULTISPECIES: DUF6191 domain-containing protein [unclassified Streptomyces]|uniref:DUF6191 domain-containing protein n=1 Tax=unclassified Streptomyces TaxID=2593676 RepID=UPI000CD512BB|nr:MULTISPECIES: DUF6191 domain-containing protein [unclassified Streptomyces]MCI4043773.1 DUF6191 domain-containing protein [Streptomyces sp. TRM75563]